MTQGQENLGEDRLLAVFRQQLPEWARDRVHHIDPDRLLPIQRTAYDKMPSGIPLFAFPSLQPNQLPGVEILSNGERIAVVPYSAMTLTGDDVQRLRLKDDELRAMKMIDDPNLYNAARLMSAARPFEKPMIIILGTASDSGYTREGTPYIILDQSLSQLEKLAVLAHEVGHFVKGHHTIEHTVRMYNDLAFRHQSEMEADTMIAESCLKDVGLGLLSKQMMVTPDHASRLTLRGRVLVLREQQDGVCSGNSVTWLPHVVSARQKVDGRQ